MHRREAEMTAKSGVLPYWSGKYSGCCEADSNISPCQELTPALKGSRNFAPETLCAVGKRVKFRSESS